jgi:hypothetical protein
LNPFVMRRRSFKMFPGMIPLIGSSSLASTMSTISLRRALRQPSCGRDRARHGFFNAFALRVSELARVVFGVSVRIIRSERMISTLTRTARSLRRTLDNMATPCSVNAYGRRLRPPRLFEVTICDLKRVTSWGVI